MRSTFEVGTVVDALRAHGARLVGGADGTSRPVRGARIAPAPNDLVPDGDGQLVVTTLADLTATEEDCGRLLGRLAAAQVAGVALCLEASEQVPSEAGAAADDITLPLIVFPPGVAIADATAAVIDALLDAQRRHLEEVLELHERFVAVSLEELIAGDAGAAEIAERAVSFGWDLGRPRAVLLAAVDPPTDSATLPPALGIIAAAARATLGADAIVWTRSTTIAALVAPETDEPAERRRIAERLRRELDERLRSVNVSIGVGRRVDDPSLLPRSFVEASRAVDVGRWAKGRHVTEVFDQLGLERLFASTPTDDLSQFVEHAIGPVLEHDRDNRGDLLETLEEWLATRNMAEAARRLHVHYNTFKNRLERIEAILGPVVGDAARSLECEVAIYIARHYEGPWSID